MAMVTSLQVYRKLLRSAAAAFKGDAVMRSAAVSEIRSKFEASRDLGDAGAVAALQAEGQEAADFLSTYVVQAALNESGNYAMTVRPEHTGALAEPVEAGMKLPREKKGKTS